MYFMYAGGLSPVSSDYYCLVSQSLNQSLVSGERLEEVSLSPQILKPHWIKNQFSGELNCKLTKKKYRCLMNIELDVGFGS